MPGQRESQGKPGGERQGGDPSEKGTAFQAPCTPMYPHVEPPCPPPASIWVATRGQVPLPPSPKSAWHLGSASAAAQIVFVFVLLYPPLYLDSSAPAASQPTCPSSTQLGVTGHMPAWSKRAVELLGVDSTMGRIYSFIWGIRITEREGNLPPTGSLPQMITSARVEPGRK